MKTGILFFLLAISLSTVAQKNKNDDFILQFTHGVGITFQKFDGLNERIAAYPQYKELKDYMGTLELGMLSEHHRVVSDMNLMVGSSLSDHHKQGSVIRFFGANMGVGYDVLKNANISLYPLAGLGLEGFQARFFRDNSTVPFESLLQDPSLQSSLHSLDFTNLFFSYRLGFGLSLRSNKDPFGSIGLRAVYTGSFNSREWRSDQEQSLMNAPEDRLSQFQIALLFGMQTHFMKH